MGALGDDDAEIKDWNLNFNLTDTQPLDSHTGKKEGGGDGKMEFWGRDLCFDDTVPVEDAFETQVLDLDGETQVMDFPDCFGGVDTQLVDEFGSDCDGEGSDTTEVLDGDVDIPRGGDTEVSDLGMNRRASDELEKNKMVEERAGLDVSTERLTVEVSKPLKHGSVPRFAAVRAASFRASGLAARKVALEKTNSGTSFLTENWNSEEHGVKSNVSNTGILEEADLVCDTGGCNGEVTGLINGKTAKIGSSTMRKLFDGDRFVEKEVLPSMDDDNVDGNDMLEMPTDDIELAGLSYMDSQEPGEATQDNAIACVERLIEENKVLFDEYDLGISTKGKSDVSFAAKGSLSLARKTNQRSACVKSAFFDFDDGQEDEGGGDIFCRRKDEFLGSKSVGKKSFTKRVKATENQADGCRDSKEKPYVVHSDSKNSVDSLKLNGKKVSNDKMTVTKNLVHDFDEECDGTTSVGQLDGVEELHVGLDTQMAAEAMEALVYGDGIVNSDANLVAGNTENFKKGSTGTKAKRSSQKKWPFSEDGDIGVATRQSRRKGVGAKTRSQPKKVNYEFCINGVMTRGKRAKADAENHMIKMVDKMPPTMVGAVESRIRDDLGGHEKTALVRTSVRKRNLPEEVVVSACAEELSVAQVESCKNNTTSLVIEAAKMLDTKGKSSDSFSIEKLNTKSSEGISCPKRRRSSRKLSAECNIYDNLDAQSKPSDHLGVLGKSVSMLTRSQRNAKTTSSGDLNKKRYTRSSETACPDLSSAYSNSKGDLTTQTIVERGPSKANETNISQGQRSSKEVQVHDRTKDASSSPSAQDKVKESPINLLRKATEPSKSTCTSPVEFMTPVNAASPVCVGDGYFKRSCKRRLSTSFVMKEISSLYDTRENPVSVPMDTRKRRDLATVRVLFSQHLDDDIIKQQTKIADRLKVSIASSITDATHFIADKFVRTRNMLEAIASGKPVVTHLWLENVGCANYYIDEQKYILRDMRKEKELGFNMQVSLAHACQNPLLQGRKVLITPNTKPSKEIIAGLVKTVCGQAVERVGRSALKDDTAPDDMLILSCEEDYEFCVPFLKKGATVYSSELLLNGIVTQKLEYGRYELFVENVKRTRSTIWLKKAGHNYSPVTKPR
ncbi:BRCT domain-containing DNA repair protein [Euphorbia peplus]|nr:BRCT domain-containing DNA repair protein [Euphorbia peplus]